MLMFDYTVLNNMKIIGIDLSGKPENPTGVCFLDLHNLEFNTLFGNEDILSYIQEKNPSLIVIDAPLSLPKGRCCLSKDCSCSKEGGHFREAEVGMRKYGRTLPLTFRGMRMLTERGIKIAEKLRNQYTVLESHPRTIQKILGFSDLHNDLTKYFELPENISEHELDAALLAITGVFYMYGEFMEFGDVDEGTIILPKENRSMDDILNFKTSL